LSLTTLADKYCPTVCRPVLNHIQQSPIGKRIVSGTFWSVIGSVLGKGLTLFSTILVARILEVKYYGEFEVICLTATMFIAFAGFGMGATSAKYISEYLVTDKKRVGRIIGLNYLFTIFIAGLLSLFFYWSCPLLSEYLVKKPEITENLRFGSVLLFLMAFMGSQVGMITGFQDFRGLAFTDTIVGFVRVPLLVFCAYFYGLFGALIAFAVSLMINLILNSHVIYNNVKKHEIQYSFRESYQEFPVLWKFSLPAALGGMISIPAFWFCGMLLVRQENGLMEYGIFIAAQKLCTMLMFIPGILVQVIVPMLSETNALNDEKLFRKITLLNLTINLVSTIMIAIPLSLLSKQIMGLYGQEFVAGAGILIVYCIASLLMAPDWIVSQVLTSRGKMWSMLFLNALWGITLISVSYFLLTLNFGGTALPLALFTAYFVRLCVVGLQIPKLFSYKIVN
jgi:O-antigen/teichoic acid export membrane protein